MHSVLQISGIAAGIHGRSKWRNLPLDLWSKIIPYLYDIKLQKKLWFDIAKPQAIARSVFDQQEQLNLTRIAQMSVKPNSIPNNEKIILSHSLIVKIKKDESFVVSVYQRRTANVVNEFVAPNDVDSITVELSLDESLLKITTKGGTSYTNHNARIAHDFTEVVRSHHNQSIQRSFIYDLDTSMVHMPWSNDPQNRVYNQLSPLPQLLITKENKILRKNGNNETFIYDVPNSNPFERLTFSQKVFLAILNQSYTADTGYKPKASLPKIGKQNGVSLAMLQRVFGTFNKEAQQQIINTYSLQVEAGKQGNCLTQ